MSKIKLFCLPFAGGSKYSYKGYSAKAPNYIEVISLDLPGRGGRFGEPFITSVEGLVNDLFNQVKGQLNSPYAIYGHSLGSLLGLLLAQRIRQEGLPAPEHLFFTGRGGPQKEVPTKKRHELPKDEFIEELKEMGGLPKELLEDEELLNFFEPIIRADFQAIDTFFYEPQPKLDIPISVIVGMEEETTLEEAKAWQLETEQPVDVRQFPGNHFFIFQYEMEIMKLIAKKLSPKIMNL